MFIKINEDERQYLIATYRSTIARAPPWSNDNEIEISERIEYLERSAAMVQLTDEELRTLIGLYYSEPDQESKTRLQQLRGLRHKE